MSEIKPPVRYDARRGTLLNSDGTTLGSVWGWSNRNATSDARGEYIAKVLNEYPEQQARIAELDAENADLRSRLLVAERKVEIMEPALKRIADRMAHGVMVTIAREALERIDNLIKEEK